jgi:nitrite reductase/ring-hydroxylating ferredoxin subunit
LARSSSARAASRASGLRLTPRDEAFLLRKLALAAQKGGRYAWAEVRCAEAIARIEGEEPLLVASLEALAGLTCCYDGRLADAPARVRRGFSHLPPERGVVLAERTAIAAALHRTHGNVLLAMGRAGEASGEFQKCVALSERLGDRLELSIALFNVGGTFYAIDNRCTHVGGPLGEGSLSGTTVTCPWHGFTVDVRTGVCPRNPVLKVRAFDVEEVGDDLRIIIDSRRAGP